MATLKIIRANEFANRLRDIKLFIDGNKLDTISNAQVKEFTISPGDHILQAKVDWCSSNKASFTISENEIKQFELISFAKGNRPGGFSMLYHIIFAPGKYLILNELNR